jgi:hypothetical protein
VRRSIAKYLDVGPAHVVLGGEGIIQNLHHPSVQIFLPSIAFSMVTNWHTDTGLPANVAFDYISQHVPESEMCEPASITSFIWPVQVPFGAGLLFFNGTEHNVLYKRGSMFAFNASLIHAVGPWPYAEHLTWTTDSSSQVRMILQAFAARCGSTWYVYG